MAEILLYNGNFIDFGEKVFKKGAILLNNEIIEKIFYKPTKIAGVQRINLNGNYVIPGFIDSHTHLLARGIELQRIDLEDCKSLNECLARLNQAKRRDVIFGVNWDESRWQKDEIGRLNCRLLNKISRKRPVIMRRICGHLAVVNTKALNLIPTNWKIVDRKSGYLYEDVVLNLNEIFRPTIEQLKRGIELSNKEALSKGITSIQEIVSPRGFNAYQSYKNLLRLRVAVYLPLKYLPRIKSLGLSSGMGDNFLKFAGIKLFMDGSIGAMTAALKKPYKYKKMRGKILIPKNSLRKIFRLAENAGIQLMIHSIGDRATDEVLSIFKEYIDKKNPLRHRLEHIEILDDTAILKISRMKLIASMQPNFVQRWQKAGGMYEMRLGKRYKQMNLFKQLLNKRALIVFGSDCMPLGPLYGIQGAISHPSSLGRLTPLEAIRLYTKEPPYCTFDEKKKGEIKPGRFADLIVLNKNPLKKENIENLKILMVFVDGRVVRIKNT